MWLQNCSHNSLSLSHTAHSLSLNTHTQVGFIAHLKNLQSHTVVQQVRECGLERGRECRELN